jgi:Phosphatidate phosphatase APP1, catalytic domain
LNDVAGALAIIADRLAGHTDRGDEAMILATLEGLDDAAFDAVVSQVDLVQLLGDVDDRIAGPKHRSQLDDMLTVSRIAALSLTSRAMLVSALQRGRTGTGDERAIERILLATPGRDLTALKNQLDAGADHRDLQQLIFSDVDNAATRARILTHFEEQAISIGEVKILSDIDDTFYANWKDQRYPAKTVYPGVLQLYAELDRGKTGTERVGDLAFVTARPKDRPGVVEKLTHATLRERGLEAATVLTGSFRNLLTSASIADKKLANFREYAALYPEYGFVFVGDSGQGDAAFGAAMREHAGDRVALVLIHDVVDTLADDRQAWLDRGVAFFDTYVGAAILAFRAGLIGAPALGRVVEQAVAELDEVPFADDAQRDAMRAAHEADRRAASRLTDGRLTDGDLTDGG